MKKSSVLFFFLVVILFSCNKETKKLSNIPSIDFSSITDSIVQGSEDTILIHFGFTDGDADLGMNSDSADLYLKSSWDSTWQDYYFPTDIPNNLKDPSKGLQGAATLKLLAALFVLDSQHPNGDTVNFEFYIKDQAGHTSNHILTTSVFIKP